jgi:enoyl-[acyl-carrier-protein] reductase (NADH)
LAARGYDVALGLVGNVEAAKETAQAVEAWGRDAPLVVGDIATDSSRMVAETLEHFDGQLDALVVTAVPVITGRLLSATRKDFTRALDVVVRGFRELVSSSADALAASANGSVVTVSSLGADRYARYYGVLGPAKAALETTVRYLAVELGGRGVRVNAVSPSLVNDPQHFADAPEVMEFLEATARRTPLRKLLPTPDDVASVITALCLPEFRAVTGQVVVVDGGYGLLA